MKVIRPTLTAAVLADIFRQHEDSAERLEAQIEDLEAELRDARNSVAEDRAARQLTISRMKLAQEITRACDTLRALDAWRVQRGRDKSVWGRILEGMNSGT